LKIHVGGFGKLGELIKYVKFQVSRFRGIGVPGAEIDPTLLT